MNDGRRPPLVESTPGPVLSLLGALCSALYLFPYKAAAGWASPGVLAYALVCVACILSSLAALVGARHGAVPRGAPWSLLLRTSTVLACLTIAGNLSSAKAVVHLAPAVASVLLRTEIVFVGILGALWLGERLSWSLIVGAIVALLGLVVMRWPLAWDGTALGALWALCAAACFAGMQVVTRRVASRVPLVLVNTLRLWLAVLAWSLLPGQVREVVAMPAAFWQQVTLAALFGPFLGRVFIMLSLRQLRAAQSALLLLLAPVVAFGIAFFAFGQRPTALELSGAALVLLGVALPTLPRRGARFRGAAERSSPRQ